MTTLTGADLVAKALADVGVRHVFAIVSIHNMPLLDAINRLGKTAIVDVRHEGAGTHAADGYARATGELGVMIASTGPGTSNTVTGLYEAQYGSSRVLVITGQAETAFYGRGVGYVHEAEKQIPMLESVCRRVESPRHPSQLGPCLQLLVNDLFTGRPAPGALEIPIDLQYAETPEQTFSIPSTGLDAPDQKQISSAAERLKRANKRVIIAGGGVICANASQSLQQLARLLDCPVLTTVDGRGVIPETDPLCVGNYYNSAAMYQAIQDADVTLAIGTRFAVGVDGQFQAQTPPGDLIQIDIEGRMVGRTHDAQYPIIADAQVALDALIDQLSDAEGNDGQFNQAVWEARDGLRVAMRKRLGRDFPVIMDSIREHLPEHGNFVRDQTISAYNWGNQQFPILQPRTSMNPSSGAIGPGFPMALGAAVGTDKPTVVVHGDGGFMFHATELATLAQYHLPVIVILCNDSGYGVLRWLQDTRFGRINETDLGKVAFADMAKSMGVPGTRVKDTNAFNEAMAAAIKTGGPHLIEIDMEHFQAMEISIMPKKNRDMAISERQA